VVARRPLTAAEVADSRPAFPLDDAVRERLLEEAELRREAIVARILASGSLQRW
jgi:hypothetical protein